MIQLTNKQMKHKLRKMNLKSMKNHKTRILKGLPSILVSQKKMAATKKMMMRMKSKNQSRKGITTPRRRKRVKSVKLKKRRVHINTVRINQEKITKAVRMNGPMLLSHKKTVQNQRLNLEKN